jgi:hypothetical protein
MRVYGQEKIKVFEMKVRVSIVALWESALRVAAKRQAVKILSTNQTTKINNIQKIMLQTPQKTKPV